ncbi:MAG: hypothetical protein AAFO81_10645 [Pseudomonadota bacterium]
MTDDAKRLLFDALKDMMSPYAAQLQVVVDQPDNFHLDTHHIMKNGKPLYFGSVRIGKRYVSYHLMPVYVTPALLDDLSAPLKKRMQGKSCFNFVAHDAQLFDELSTLTAAGFQSYVDAGYIEPA